MSGNGGSGGGWALTLCGGVARSGALTLAILDCGRTPLTDPPVLGCKTPLGRLDGGRLFGSNGKWLGGMPGVSADGGGKLTSAFDTNLPCAGP